MHLIFIPFYFFSTFQKWEDFNYIVYRKNCSNYIALHKTRGITDFDSPC